MIIRLLAIALATIGASAFAAPPLHPPGLLPTSLARPLLEQDPAVAAARAGLDVALQEANALASSPHEWTARTSSQRRRVDSGPSYREWNVGIERTFRLPGKAAADRNLGKATVDESQAHYGEALHESARELMALWVDWLAAERARELAEASLQSTQDSLSAVEKRVRAGDASKLDLGIARAELAKQRRMDNDAKTQASAAWLRLSTRFPGISQQIVALPMPLPLGHAPAFWRERILDESDELKIVQTKLQLAQAHAERARADKIADPTLGVFTASEIGGRERISGITVTIPLPGGARSARGAKAIASVEVSRHAYDSKKRQMEAEILSAVATAQGAFTSQQIANEGAAAMQDNAKLMQRAYSLGEAQLQALLLARRQATAAFNSALQAQVAALKGYYGLLIDAHLVWDLEHD